MNMRNEQSELATVELSLPVEKRFSGVVIGFVESAAEAFQVPAAQGRPLVLATEEVYAYLAASQQRRSQISVSCFDGRYYMAVELVFDAQGFDPRSFNLVREKTALAHSDLDQLGLVIAARSVDGFELRKEERERIHLRLLKLRTYPADISGTAVAATGELGAISIREVNGEMAETLGAQIAGAYQSVLLPFQLQVPKRTADMIDSGDLLAVVAEDIGDRVGGALFWRRMGNRVVEFFGPYTFDAKRRTNIGLQLIEACIHRLAKSDIVCLIGRYAADPLPFGYFEQLGSITSYTDQRIDQPVWIKLMHEDPGAVVWADSSVEAFLRAEYQRLAFARDVRIASRAEDNPSSFSVIAGQFDRGGGRVTLQPMWPGTDAMENLTRHVASLSDEGLTDILFEVDLGVSWQAGFLPALAATGFVPRIILPYAGRRDVLVLQYQRKAVN